MTRPAAFPILLFALALAALAASGAARAHAVVAESTPAAGGAVAGPEVAIVLRYNTRIDKALSRLHLLDPGDRARPVAIATDGPPDTLAAAASGLAPGTYRIRWQVLAVDGHITRGEVPFRVEAP